VNRTASVGLGVAVLVLGLSVLFTQHRITHTHSIVAAMPAPPTPHEPIARPHDAPADDVAEDVDGLIDLYGNGVSPAVATYSLDALGSLYEEHSPQTELPRLGSPKT
jgi:hypothetical protein